MRCGEGMGLVQRVTAGIWLDNVRGKVCLGVATRLEGRKGRKHGAGKVFSVTT